MREAKLQADVRGEPYQFLRQMADIKPLVSFSLNKKPYLNCCSSVILFMQQVLFERNILQVTFISWNNYVLLWRNQRLPSEMLHVFVIKLE